MGTRGADHTSDYAATGKTSVAFAKKRLRYLQEKLGGRWRNERHGERLFTGYRWYLYDVLLR